MYKACLRTSTVSVVQQNGLVPLFDYRIIGTVFKNQKIGTIFRFYIFVRYAKDRLYRLKTMYIFDIRINTWSTKQTKSSAQQYPCDREDDSFAFSTNTCYLSGGEDDVEFYTDIWKIDFESIEWCKLDYVG
ncbi:hypothetical protein RF11_08645 [Thelohanellus kitauei]|uniref:Uncharacterized protein n=1 Tax=Thelohanellus kitauei TaxID=669202 RepID=A0A0C2N7C9_THEKT|nr:hypothetical protein RF11_08645 [Thelohanellus kitauei]